MSMITSQINHQIEDLQSMASALADYDPDGDRILDEGLKSFLISVCICMLERATMIRTVREAMMQYILDQTDLGFAINDGQNNLDWMKLALYHMCKES